MGQSRQQQRHGDTKAAILSAARIVILEHGPARLSWREVARHAGFSPAGLYEYFGSKEELIQAVADEALGRLYTQLDRAARDLPPAEAIVELGMAYSSFARHNPEDFLLIFAQLPSQRSSLELPVRRGSPYQHVVDVVQAGVAGGVFRADLGVEQIAYGVWALAHGMAMLQLTHLREFKADFVDSDRRLLERFVTGLQIS